MTVDVSTPDIHDSAQLMALEDAVREQWRLGQNIVLCWCAVPEGLRALFVPHYYLGNFSASLNDSSPTDRLDLLNGRFIRQLISGPRRMSDTDFFSTAHRLDLDPVLLRSPINVDADSATLERVEQLLKRYSISYVESRAALLFDIVDFSLYSPFEQTSQLNSLSYSLNSACSKLLKKNIAVDFARTTTGDGFYVWNRDPAPRANVDLFLFMLLVIADNAIAGHKAGDLGHTVPLLRTAFHIGGHFEFTQVEGVNPTLHSYIVGDLTIELARMVDLARPGQIFIGDFKTVMPTSRRESAFPVEVDSQHFVERGARHLELLRGLELSGECIETLQCQLTGAPGVSAGQSVRRFRITDKHGRSRHAYNLRINIYTSRGDRPLLLGIQDYFLPKPAPRAGREQADAEASPKARLHQPRLLPED